MRDHTHIDTPDALDRDPALEDALVGLASFELEAAEDDGGLDALLAAIESDQDTEVGPRATLRSMSSTKRRLLVTGVAVAVIALNFFALRRVDLAVYPLGRLVVELGILALLSGGLLAAVLRPTLMAPGRLALLGVAFAAAVPVILGLVPAAHGEQAASLVGAGPDLAKRALACLGWGLACAAPVLVAMTLVERQPDPRPGRDAVFAAAAGTAGLLALQLHCPITQPIHLLAGHAPVVLAALAMFVGARRLLGSRS